MEWLLSFFENVPENFFHFHYTENTILLTFKNQAYLKSNTYISEIQIKDLPIE